MRIGLGSGAGYSGDRIEPALELAEHGELDYLIFECLAERTIALAQQAKLKDPAGGFDPLLERPHARGARHLCAQGRDASSPTWARRTRRRRGRPPRLAAALVCRRLEDRRRHR